jgi:hypothetical protein
MSQSNAKSFNKTITRPNDVVAYTANDVIGAATGSTAAIEITGLMPGRPFNLANTKLLINSATVLAGMTTFNLHFYSKTPPSALGDNVAWDLPSGDQPFYLGFVSLGTPVDVGSAIFVQTNNINTHIVPQDTSIFAYLVTVGGWTPAANTTFNIQGVMIDP